MKGLTQAELNSSARDIMLMLKQRGLNVPKLGGSGKSGAVVHAAVCSFLLDTVNQVETFSHTTALLTCSLAKKPRAAQLVTSSEAVAAVFLDETVAAHFAIPPLFLQLLLRFRHVSSIALSTRSAPRRSAATPKKVAVTLKQVERASGWAKGTGYGGAEHRGGTDVNRRAIDKAHEREREAGSAFVFIFREFATALRFASAKLFNLWPLPLPGEAAAALGSLSDVLLPYSTCVGAMRAAIRQSGILRLVVCQLRGATVQSVSEDGAAFDAAMDLVMEIARSPLLLPLLLEKTDNDNGGRDGADADVDAETDADADAGGCGGGGSSSNRYGDARGEGGNEAGGAGSAAGSNVYLHVPSTLPHHSAAALLLTLIDAFELFFSVQDSNKCDKSLQAMFVKLQTAKSTIDISAAALQAPVMDAIIEGICASHKRRRGRPASDIVALKMDPVAAQYVNRMRPLRFDSSDFVLPGHLYEAEARQGGVRRSGMKRMRRISSEIAALSDALPVEPGSAIFLRRCDEYLDVFKALIVGPEDTPYEGGLFEFDILLPPQYPDAPPKVRLVTTGGGTVRFNPNLYKDGKVCLSLLGTWSGPGWDPKLSTLLQVLVSIQALIFVGEPYFNEPGYEKAMHDERVQQQAKDYERRVREDTLRHAIVAQLMHPPRAFADVVAQYRRLRGRRLLDLGRRWHAEAFAHERRAAKKRKQEKQPSRRGAVVKPEEFAEDIAAALNTLTEMVGGGEEDEEEKQRRVRRRRLLSGWTADDAVVAVGEGAGKEAETVDLADAGDQEVAMAEAGAEVGAATAAGQVVELID